MAVAFIPYGQPRKHFCRLGDISLEDVDWPLNDCPEGRTLSDLGPEDHVLMIASSRMLTIKTHELRCQLSIILCEPPAIQKRYYRAVRWLSSRFKYVLTHNTDLLAKLPNARFVSHGGTFLNEVEQPKIEKTKRISLIASKKTTTDGHRLRHELVNWAAGNMPDLEALGHGYHSLKDKADGHTPYQFSVVVENTREPGFFTEKLIDSFLCRSLPIYWGAPDIEHFFDPRGMIVCRTTAELKHAICAATPADYDSREPYLERNRLLAFQHLDQFGRAAQTLRHFGSDLMDTSGLAEDIQALGAA